MNNEASQQMAGAETAKEALIIKFTARQIAKTFGLIASFIVLSHILITLLAHFTDDTSLFFGLNRLFHLNKGGNLPTFYSGLLFLFCSALLLITWRVKGMSGQRNFAWLSLAAAFLFLAYDEFFKVHEPFMESISRATGAAGVFYLTCGVGVLAISVIFFPTWRRLPAKDRIRFAASALIYLGGAVGFEILGGLAVEKTGSKSGLIYGTLYIIEESLEMAGLIMFAYSLLHFLFGGFGITLEIIYQTQKYR